MKDFEAKIRNYLTERNWDKLRPGDISKSIAIEAAELMEIFQWSNPSLSEIKADQKKLEEVKKELADVMIYCFDMAVLLDLDVETILNQKLQKVMEKYPKELFAEDRAEDAGIHEKYQKIKKEHRLNGTN